MLHKFSHRFRATYNASRAKNNKCLYVTLSNFRTPVSFSYFYFFFFPFLINLFSPSFVFHFFQVFIESEFEEYKIHGAYKFRV